MRKLYWHSYENEDKWSHQEGWRFKALGGLGIATSPDPCHFRKTRVVAIRRFEGIKELSVSFDTVPYLLSGKDYLQLSNGSIGVKELEKDIALRITDSGKAAECWTVVPTLIIPFYNDDIDKDYELWEIFEEGGFLYGLDKRTNKIYEVKHFVTHFQDFMGLKSFTLDMWVINNKEDYEATAYSFLDLIKISTLKDFNEDWATTLSDNTFQLLTKMVSSHKSQESKRKLIMDRVVLDGKD